MFTEAGARHQRLPAVLTRSELLTAGVSRRTVDSQLAARRWRRIGRAILTHNASPTRKELWQVARMACGPHAVLTAFTALEAYGLSGWARDEVHVLAPAGTQSPRLPGVAIKLHRTARWERAKLHPTRKLHEFASALLLAAATFESPRPAVGIVAAAVQQRLVTPARIRAALTGAPRLRHRAALVAALADIEQGAEALSEIDFAKLCRAAGLPEPVRQAVRVERSGRRRYLDAEWVLADGRRVAAEVDGAAHLTPSRWWADQLRQNELALTGTTVLRFPSVVVRTEPELVVDCLRRALGYPTSRR